MGFWEKLKKIYMGDVFGSAISEADEAFFDDLEEMLILADVGMTASTEAVQELRQRMIEDKISGPEPVKACLREILAEKLSVGDFALDLSTRPSVVLVVGVNGVGKTTSIGKLANSLRQQGKRVLLCAGDTFRAAAADQLEIWANRSRCEIVRQKEGADPGAVLFDALQAAKARGVDVVICDTAGRLHNGAGQAAQDHRPGAAGGRAGDFAGAGRHHRAERADSGQAVPGNFRLHRNRTDQAGRYRKGRHRHCHRSGIAGAREAGGPGRRHR